MAHRCSVEKGLKQHGINYHRSGGTKSTRGMGISYRAVALLVRVFFCYSLIAKIFSFQFPETQHLTDRFKYSSAIRIYSPNFHATSRMQHDS